MQQFKEVLSHYSSTLECIPERFQRELQQQIQGKFQVLQFDYTRREGRYKEVQQGVRKCIPFRVLPPFHDAFQDPLQTHNNAQDLDSDLYKNILLSRGYHHHKLHSSHKFLDQLGFQGRVNTSDRKILLSTSHMLYLHSFLYIYRCILAHIFALNQKLLPEYISRLSGSLHGSCNFHHKAHQKHSLHNGKQVQH